jgi:hypothetical protein
MFTETEIMEAHRDEIRDPRKRSHRRAPWRSQDTEKSEPPPAKCVTPLLGMQRMDRASAMDLLRRTVGEGALQFVPEFGWVYASTTEAGLASDNDVRRELMGSWLGELANYTHFCTWTFSRPVTVAGAMDFGKKHLRFLARWDVDTERGGTVSDFLKLNRYRDVYEQRKDERARQKAARKRLQAFLATERGETGGLVHLHALVAKITHLRAFCGIHLPEGTWGVKCCMLHSWPCGYARVFPYDPALGAKHYVSKYVIKGHLGEWDLLGEFHCPGRACSLALH